MENSSLRILPSNTDMEAALLGCLLNDGRLFAKIEDSGLLPEDFSQERNAVVFRAIRSVFESQQLPDVLTVTDAVSKMKNPVEPSYIFDLANNAPIIYEETLQQYCSTIQEKSLYREMIGICENTIDSAFRQQESFEELSDKATTSLITLSNRRQVTGYSELKDLVVESLKKLEFQQKSGATIQGISSGYPYLDNMCSGFKPGDMIVLAGRPGMGKTGFALNIALAIAKKHLNVLFFSLEMPAEQITNRILSIECSINSRNILNGKLDQEEINRLYANLDSTSSLPIYIDETPSITISDLRSKAKKLDAQLRKDKDINPNRQIPNKLDCIFIDYLQLMSSNVFKEDKVRQVEDISKNIKKLAKDLNIPIVAMAQLNRKIEERRGGKMEISGNKPMLSDLKDSGSIEQDADMVMFIHREDAYKKNEEEKNNEAEIFVQKNRHGPTGTVRLRFTPQYMKFTPLDTSADNYEH